MIRKTDLIDVPERRSVPFTEFEVRSTSSEVHVEGYASIFDKGYDIYGGPDGGGWTEHVNRSAFRKTLAATPDVVLLENHAGGPLARTKSGTLQLSTDTTGLITSATLDRRDPQVQSIFVKMDRKDYDEMSFAFRVKAQTWSDDETIRGLDEVSLHKGDVSIVNFGANPFTSVGLRSAVKMLARNDLGPKEMAELRAMSDQVDAAMAALESSRTDAPLTPGTDHADPGYLDADGNPAKDGNGVPRYQLDDKAHAADAASRFAEFKDKYTPAQQQEILGKIHAAEKKFGVKAEQNSLTDRATVGASFAQAVHDMASNSGADCSVGFDDGSDPAGSLAQAVHDLVADAAACANVVDDSQYSESLSIDDRGAMPETPVEDVSITTFKTPQGPMVNVRYKDVEKICGSLSEAAEWLRRKSAKTGTWLDDVGPGNLTIADVSQIPLSDENLSIADARRMCRPDDSPEPLTIEDALKIAS